MRIEIITIGNELLNGDLADTNTRTLATRLRALGLGVARSQTVPDEVDTIASTLRRVAERAALVFVTGGLGPTDDDLTLQAAALFGGHELVLNEPALAWIQDHYSSRGRTPLPSHRRQAMLPEGAIPLTNRAGIAPGVMMSVGQTTFFFFPGVPGELRAIFDDHAVPWIHRNVETRPAHSHTFRTFGLSEARVAQRLEDLESNPAVHVAFRARFPEIQVTLHVTASEREHGEALLERYRERARTLLGDIVYSESRKHDLARVVADSFGGLDLPKTLAVAESCTGGLIGSMLTDISGVSAWFIESAVCYANDAKVRRLGVPEGTLMEHGAVSEATAIAMAEGIRSRAGADIGIATTGIAGPTGGTPNKPVGTIHVALAHSAGTEHRLLKLSFGRSRNRTLTAWAALDMLRRHLQVPPAE